MNTARRTLVAIPLTALAVLGAGVGMANACTQPTGGDTYHAVFTAGQDLGTPGNVGDNNIPGNVGDNNTAGVGGDYSTGSAASNVGALGGGGAGGNGGITYWRAPNAGP